MLSPCDHQLKLVLFAVCLHFAGTLQHLLLPGNLLAAPARVHVSVLSLLYPGLVAVRSETCPVWITLDIRAGSMVLVRMSPVYVCLYACVCVCSFLSTHTCACLGTPTSIGACVGAVANLASALKAACRTSRHMDIHRSSSCGEPRSNPVAKT